MANVNDSLKDLLRLDGALCTALPRIKGKSRGQGCLSAPAVE